MLKKTVIFIFVFFALFSCKKDEKTSGIKDEYKKFKIGIALGVGGLGDQSFNDMQYNGLIELSKNHIVDIFYEVPSDDSPEEMERILEKLCSEYKCDFVIAGAGYLMIEPLDKISEKYKNIKFVLIDDFAVLKDNVSSIIFAQHEGSFVVGALAAYLTKTKKVGFIGAVDMQIIKSFLVGFEEGVKYADPNVSLAVQYISFEKDNDYSGYDNPKKANIMAKVMYDSGVDIIYSVAGASGNGIIQSAMDNKKYVIGVDSNQDYMAKGFVLTSMMKRLDNAVFDISQEFIEDKFEGNKTYLYSYKNGGVSITDMKYTRDIISDEVIEKVRNIEKNISLGKIKITNLMESAVE